MTPTDQDTGHPDHNPVNLSISTAHRTPRPTAMESLLAYPQALARHLVALREQQGLTPEHTATLLAIPPTTLLEWENGTRRPSMPRLLRLTTLYQTPLLHFLDHVAREVRPPDDPSQPSVVEALLLWNGVAPEQLHGITPAAGNAFHHDGQDGQDQPLRDAVLYRRSDDPVRINAGRRIAQEYEVDPSIRVLAARHHLSFGVVRSLLHEAGAAVRSPGGSNNTARPGGEIDRPDP
ncbi:helix-turn-helix domain-containing protein [Saccharothrix xinjiangensis]|uniref:Helix-turn-helix domain-containing protein n=1 Tax=Saccharothrix xinjiangensis TaxID=204798 RepID=A0ABV9Y2L2_9PSEU